MGGPDTQLASLPVARQSKAESVLRDTPEILSLHYGVAADYRWVSVGVFDISGRLVRALREGAAQTGEYDLTWDGMNEHGDPVASGVYFVRVRVGQETLERKIVLLR